MQIQDLLKDTIMETGVNGTIAYCSGYLLGAVYGLNRHLIAKAVLTHQIVYEFFCTCNGYKYRENMPARLTVKAVGLAIIGTLGILALRQLEAIAKKGTIAASVALGTVVLLNLTVALSVFVES